MRINQKPDMDALERVRKELPCSCGRYTFPHRYDKKCKALEDIEEIERAYTSRQKWSNIEPNTGIKRTGEI